MLDFMTIARALTDENRVRILMALRDRELCVCQVTAFLDLSPSTTSKHLSILKQSRLIESRKKGKWVYYRLASGETCQPMARAALEWAVAGAGDSPVVREDARRIRETLEREATFRTGMDVDADSFHSLEIHTLSDTEFESTEEKPS